MVIYASLITNFLKSFFMITIKNFLFLLEQNRIFLLLRIPAAKSGKQKKRASLSQFCQKPVAAPFKSGGLLRSVNLQTAAGSTLVTQAFLTQ